MRNKISEFQRNFIKENYSDKGISFCIEELNLPKSTITSIARRFGLRVKSDVLRKNMSKKIINIAEYINITDPKIAYILGLVWTDGHVTYSNNLSKTPIIKHSCIEKDSVNSDKIFNELGWRKFISKNNQSIGKNDMSINWISSRDLGDYLVSNNFRDKNKGTKITKNIKPEILSHFLRGILDGDGCITISKSGKLYKQTTIYFSSNINQDWLFLTSILDSINVEHKHRICSDSLGKSSQIYINKTESIYNLCEYIYIDSDDKRLERKFDKYTEFKKYKKKMCIKN